MYLLSGHSLTVAKKIPLQSLNVTLKERESVASMVPLDMNGIYYNSWFYDEAYPNGGTVWRVKSITQDYDTHTPTVQLEHAIYLLKDRLMFGEVKAGEMAGNASAETCTAEQAVRYILSYQEDWVLGDFGYNVSNPYKFNGDTLFDALETVTKSLKDAWWVCDTTVYPFKLSIIPKDATVFAEMRCGRNIKTIRRTVDKSGMYTRFYPIGKDDLHIDGDYIEMNSYQYGIIGKVDTDTSIDSKDELRRWAIEQLEIHSEPIVTIEVDGFELADATGEPMDKLTLGRICRVPLPEYGTTITERIVSLQYPDKVRQPRVVKVTLSNSRTDVMKVLAEALKKSGSGGRAAAQQQKEDHAWFVDTDEKVGMVAKSIVGSGPGAWERISSLIVDGEGIHAKVERNEQGLVTAYTQIDMNEQRILIEADRAISAENVLNASIVVEADRITQEVSNRISGQTELSSRITQTATRIESEVEARIAGDTNLDSRITQTANMIDMEVTRATAAEDSLSGRITVEADRIGLVVSGTGVNAKINPASIVAAINEQTGQSKVTISADQIDINGLVNRLTSYDIEAESLSAHQITSDGECSFDTITVDSLQVNGNTNVLVDAEVNGNVLTLTYDDGSTVTFSKAVTLTGAWSNGTITASAGNQSWYSTIKTLAASEVSWNGNTASFPVKAYNNGAEVAVNTGKTLSLDASSRYTAGQQSKYVNNHTVGAVGAPSQSGGSWYSYATVTSDYSTGGSYATSEQIDVTAAYNAGAASGESLVTDITLWDGNTQLSGTVSVSSSVTAKAWCKYNGTWKEGASVTFNNPYSYSADLTFTESKVIGSVTYFYYYSVSGITTGTKRVHW